MLCKLWSERIKCLEECSNQINSLNTLKNELMKIFRGFRVFEHALWQKNENPEMPKSTESLLNKTTPIANCYH